MLRPASTRWFEVLCPRSEGVHTVAELAATGAIEVEVREGSQTHRPVADITAGLSQYADLNGRYQRYWSRGVLRRQPLVEAPAVAIERGLARIHAWRQEADPLIDTLQACEEELVQLRWLAEILSRVAEGSLDFALVTRTGPVLGSFCAILPADADPKLPDWVIPRSVPWQDERCYMILGPSGAPGPGQATDQGGQGKGHRASGLAQGWRPGIGDPYRRSQGVSLYPRGASLRRTGQPLRGLRTRRRTRGLGLAGLVRRARRCPGDGQRTPGLDHGLDQRPQWREPQRSPGPRPDPGPGASG